MQAYPQVSNTFHNKKCKNSKHLENKLLLISINFTPKTSHS